MAIGKDETSLAGVAGPAAPVCCCNCPKAGVSAAAGAAAAGTVADVDATPLATVGRSGILSEEPVSCADDPLVTAGLPCDEALFTSSKVAALNSA